MMIKFIMILIQTLYITITLDNDDDNKTDNINANTDDNRRNNKRQIVTIMPIRLSIVMEIIIFHSNKSECHYYSYCNEQQTKINVRECTQNLHNKQHLPNMLTRVTSSSSMAELPSNFQCFLVIYVYIGRFLGVF